MSDTIICPNCQFEIEVTEVLSAQLRSQLQKEFEADIFTEYRATQKWLMEVLAAEGLTGNDRLMTMYGGMDSHDRDGLLALLRAVASVAERSLRIGAARRSENGRDVPTVDRRRIGLEAPRKLRSSCDEPDPSWPMCVRTDRLSRLLRKLRSEPIRSEARHARFDRVRLPEELLSHR